MMPPDVAAQYREEPCPNTLDEDAITKLLPFTGLDPAQIRTVLSRATLRHVPANMPYFEAGAPADHFFLLLDGVVRVAQTTSEGEQVILMHILPGQMFGIARAFSDATYQTSARAASPALALSWPAELWEPFSRDYPGFACATRRAVGLRATDLREKIVAMATLQVEQRIAHVIADLARRAGKQTRDGIEIGFPITRQDISEMTGTTLYSVSRYMSKWQKCGIVTSSRRRVTVCRPEALPV